MDKVGIMLTQRHRRLPSITSALTGLDGSFVSTGACNLWVPGSNPGRDGYLSSWLCIYTVLQTVQRNGVHSAAYGRPGLLCTIKNI